jgi:hypothetical protein
MDLVAALIAGILATAPMTAFMYLAPRVRLARFDIIRILGTFFTADTQIAIPMGTVMHFGIGGIFSTTYAALWNLGIGRVSPLWGVIFGAVHGLLAMFLILMPLLFAKHPRPGDMRIIPALFTDWIAHLIFGLFVALLYAAFRK